MTICPDFTRRVPNFDSLSQENYEVTRDAELSRIPKPVPILSRCESSHVAVDHFVSLPVVIVNSLITVAFYLLVKVVVA